MSDTPELTGPDLGAGVPEKDIPESGQLLGHAEGEAVLLARRGSEVFAVGATCSHYSGPLADGLVVGDTIRCPWHHACFSLRTGEALRAPGLAPIACWNVRVESGRVFVRGKKESSVPRPKPAFSPNAIAIVGGGAAGNAAAEMVRRQGYSGPVALITAEPGTPVDRPNLSKDYLAGTAPEEYARLHDEDFYRQEEISVVRGRAQGVDVAKKEVVLDGGKRVAYGALLLATGADPIRLNTPGSDAAHVHYLRSIEDSQRLIAAATRAKNAVVIGASFIGLEAAASLRSRDVPVAVVAPESRPLERILGPEMGDFVRGLHEEHGVRFHLGRTAREIRSNAVVLDDGVTLDADLVVVGVGVRPALGLAEAAGCRIDRGVVVNEYLETSVPGIFAAGDIVRFPDHLSGQSIRVEHWVVAERMGQAAARNMLGAKQAYRDVPFFWSQHYDVPINYVGHAEQWDRVEVVGKASDKDCIAAYWAGDRIAALASIYRDKESLAAEVAFEEGQNSVRKWWSSLPR